MIGEVIRVHGSLRLKMGSLSHWSNQRCSKLKDSYSIFEHARIGIEISLNKHFKGAIP